MCKAMVVSGALVLLLGSLALGQIDQLQGFGIGGENIVAILEGPDSAHSTQVVQIGQTQASDGVGGLVKAFQGQFGVLGQGAGIAGLGAMSLNQQAAIGGLQQQGWTKALNLGQQYQGIGVDFLEQASKLGSPGVLLGSQTFMGVQVQVIGGPYGGSLNVQPIVVTDLQTAAQ